MTRETDDDAATLAALYEAHAPAIYARCRRLLGSPAAARDATQEAFVRVIARKAPLPPGEEALRYLYRVSTNVCLDQLRERRVHLGATSTLHVQAERGETAEGSHAARQFVTALLDKCDETGVAIAIMHHLDGLSQVEVASVLGITRRTVFNRLRKIEELAAQLLGGKGQDVAPQLTKKEVGA